MLKKELFQEQGGQTAPKLHFGAKCFSPALSCYLSYYSCQSFHEKRTENVAVSVNTWLK